MFFKEKRLDYLSIVIWKAMPTFFPYQSKTLSIVDNKQYQTNLW